MLFPWDTFCQKCIDRFPEMNALVKKFGDQVHFIAIAKDSPKELTPYLETYPFDFLQISDAELWKYLFDYFGTHIQLAILDQGGVIYQFYFRETAWFGPYQPQKTIGETLTDLLDSKN